MLMIVVGKLIPRSSGTLSTNITQEQPRPTPNRAPEQHAPSQVLIVLSSRAQLMGGGVVH
ncbi:MAG: hypothetical protein RXO22_09620 [Thermocladium sp.]